MATISSNGTTKEKQRLDLESRSSAKDNHRKSKKKNELFEKRLLNLISNPHQDMLTQIDSITNHISL
jgi:hypothetical protein